MRAGAHRPSGVLHAAVLALSATVPLNRAQQQEPPCSSCSTSSSSGVGRIFSAGYHGRNPQIHPNALVLWGKTLSEPDAQRVQSSFKVIKMKKKKKSLWLRSACAFCSIVFLNCEPTVLQCLTVSNKARKTLSGVPPWQALLPWGRCISCCCCCCFFVCSLLHDFHRCCCTRRGRLFPNARFLVSYSCSFGGLINHIS